jgi:outer membrane protein assembly factor BamB
MVFGADGNMYVLSNFNSFYGSLSTSGVLKYRTDGTFRGKFANTGGDYLRFGPNGDLFVTVSGRIDRYRGSDGTFVGTFVSSGGAAAFGPDGKLYVSSSNNRVLRYDGTTGAFIDTFVASGSGGLNGPSDLAFGPDGDLYVCSSNYPLGSSASVLRYSGTTGSFIDAFVPSSLPNKMYVTSFMTFGDIPEPSSLVLLIFFTATVTRRPMHIQPA